jgi:hypothetical protein
VISGLNYLLGGERAKAAGVPNAPAAFVDAGGPLRVFMDSSSQATVKQQKGH